MPEAPVGVDLASVIIGPMEVTVDDDGKTHVRHIYTVPRSCGYRILPEKAESRVTSATK